jgi:rhodanese-related sulfurtransferase
MSPKGVHDHMKKEHVTVLDVRNYDAFGGQHIPGAINIYLQAIFATFAGWVLPQDAEIILVAEHDAEVQEAAVWLRRVGIDHITGYLKGGMFAWASQGLPTAQVSQIPGSRLHEMVCNDEAMVLIDVRSPAEAVQSSIKGAVNIPAPDLRTRYKEIDASLPAVLFCSSGFRGSMGCSILKQRGIHHVCNVAGGMAGYHAAGYGRACRACRMPHGPRIPER